MSENTGKMDYCPICYDSRAAIYRDKVNKRRYLCDCCICGRFVSNEEIDFANIASEYDIDEVASFLFHNGDKSTKDKDFLRLKIFSFDGEMIDNDDYFAELGIPEEVEFSCIPVNPNTIKNWMPKSFSEKIDKILFFLEKETSRYGEILEFSENEVVSLLFLKRHEWIHGCYAERLSIKEIISQTDFFADWITGEKYVTMSDGLAEKWGAGWDSDLYPEMFDTRMRSFSISLTPIGFKRIDTVDRDGLGNRNVFVAMQFKDTAKLRECIKEGIEKAGYNPILIDEVEHNNQIMPEILYNIRRSLFVVAELTHKNPGAYLEEGYALGYGKPVIQLCRDDALQDLHFDIRQKSTVVWTKEEEIPEKLCKRIKATME